VLAEARLNIGTQRVTANTEKVNTHQEHHRHHRPHQSRSPREPGPFARQANTCYDKRPKGRLVSNLLVSGRFARLNNEAPTVAHNSDADEVRRSSGMRSGSGAWEVEGKNAAFLYILRCSDGSF